MCEQYKETSCDYIDLLLFPFLSEMSLRLQTILTWTWRFITCIDQQNPSLYLWDFNVQTSYLYIMIMPLFFIIMIIWYENTSRSSIDLMNSIFTKYLKKYFGLPENTVCSIIYFLSDTRPLNMTLKPKASTAKTEIDKMLRVTMTTCNQDIVSNTGSIAILNSKKQTTSRLIATNSVLTNLLDIYIRFLTFNCHIEIHKEQQNCIMIFQNFSSFR